MGWGTHPAVEEFSILGVGHIIGTLNIIGGPFCWGTRTGLITILIPGFIPPIPKVLIPPIPMLLIPGIIPGMIKGDEGKSLETVGCPVIK